MTKIGTGISKFSTTFLAIVFLLGIATATLAQSNSLDFPTPVITNEVRGTIEARDIGDSRVTRHYFQLSGTTGDLNLNIQYTNLNGDVDIFTADTMRPLAKVSLVASDNPISVDRTIFLRGQENLILRIEARSANDDPGRYRIGFSGTFVASEDTGTAPDAPTVSSAATKGKRVTSSGALIPEPPVAKVDPLPAPVTEPTAVAPPKPKTTGKTARTTTTKPAKPATTGNTGRTTPTPRKPVAKKPAVTTPPTPTRPPAETARSTKRTASTAKKPDPAAPKPPATPSTPDPMANARLVVDTRDGMHREHYLRDVRRFTVEKGQLVVILKNGKVELEPMSNVLKVTIEP
ncbi:MAG: hypothetical protein ABIP75_13250 [Pyrinomonadaceae bacterium]